MFTNVYIVKKEFITNFFQKTLILVVTVTKYVNFFPSKLKKKEKRKKKKPTLFLPDLGSVAEGNTTIFFLA